MPTIPTDAVEPGDILLVTQRPRDPLAGLILELDRSPGHFSHSGLAGGNGTIISSYPQLDGVVPVDLGGLHHDPYEHFTTLHQSVYRLELPEGADREAVAKRLTAEYPEDRDGAFAWSKIVMVAAALHALTPGRGLPDASVYEIIQRAIDAGTAWHSSDDFFCAEFAAQLYGRPYTLGELRPPRHDSLVFFPTIARAVVAIGRKILTLHVSELQRRTLDALVHAVHEHDPEFFETGVRVLSAEVPFLVKEATRRNLVPEEHPRLPDSTELPYALVTPRMVAAWGTGVTEIAAAVPEDEAAPS